MNYYYYHIQRVIISVLLAAQPPLVAMKGFIRVVVVEWGGTVWLPVSYTHTLLAELS